MFKIICVTNRHLCPEPLDKRIRRLVQPKPTQAPATLYTPDFIVLREKDLPEVEYLALAERTLPLCEGTGVELILHNYPEVAWELGYNKIHLPLQVLRSLTDTERKRFNVLGASCHSLVDVQEAKALGCTYVTLGHIFATNCKKGIEPRGLPFLESVCSQSDLPVYAIGGIRSDTIGATKNAGAQGACIMSGLMVCQDPASEIRSLRTMAEDTVRFH